MKQMRSLPYYNRLKKVVATLTPADVFVTRDVLRDVREQRIGCAAHDRSSVSSPQTAHPHATKPIPTAKPATPTPRLIQSIGGIR